MPRVDSHSPSMPVPMVRAPTTLASPATVPAIRPVIGPRATAVATTATSGHADANDCG